MKDKIDSVGRNFFRLLRLRAKGEVPGPLVFVQQYHDVVKETDMASVRKTVLTAMLLSLILESADTVADLSAEAKSWTAQELVQQIAESEARIRSLELSYEKESRIRTPKITRPKRIMGRRIRTPMQTRTIHYSRDWGYEGGKWYSVDTNLFRAYGQNNAEKSKIRSVCDGEKVYPLNDSSVRQHLTGSIESSLGEGCGLSLIFRARRCLSEILRDAVEVTVQEKPEDIDGHSCTVIRANGIADGIWLTRNYRFWIDTQRDFQPLRIEKYRSHKPWEEGESLDRRLDRIELKKIDGLWFPVEGRQTRFNKRPSRWSRKPDSCRILNEQGSKAMEAASKEYWANVKLVRYVSKVQEIAVDDGSIRINKGISAEKFRMEFPPGCVVGDDFREDVFRVGDDGKFIPLRRGVSGGMNITFCRPKTAAFCGTTGTIERPKTVRVRANKNAGGVLKLVRFETSSEKIKASCEQEKGVLIFTITLVPDCPKGRWHEYVKMTVMVAEQERIEEIPVHIVVK